MHAYCVDLSRLLLVFLTWPVLGICCSLEYW